MVSIRAAMMQTSTRVSPAYFTFLADLPALHEIPQGLS
jgi:hypothetical protein